MSDWRLRKRYGFGCGKVHVSPHPLLPTEAVSVHRGVLRLVAELGPRACGAVLARLLRTTAFRTVLVGLGAIVLASLVTGLAREPEEILPLDLRLVALLPPEIELFEAPRELVAEDPPIVSPEPPPETAPTIELTLAPPAIEPAAPRALQLAMPTPPRPALPQTAPAPRVLPDFAAIESAAQTRRAPRPSLPVPVVPASIALDPTPVPGAIDVAARGPEVEPIQVNTGEGPGQPSIQGAPLTSLAACRTDREEDLLKQQLLASVQQPTCRSDAGSYRFVETRNLNAFLMWVQRSTSRGEENRCEEMVRALDCIAQQRVKESRRS